MNVNQFVTYIKYIKNLHDLISLNLNNCKLLKWNAGLTSVVFKMSSLRVLNMIEIKLNSEQVLELVNKLDNLVELSFTYQNTRQISNLLAANMHLSDNRNNNYSKFEKLKWLEVDITLEDVTVCLFLEIISWYAINLEHLKLFSMNRHHRHELRFETIKLTRLNEIIISNCPSLMLHAQSQLNLCEQLKKLNRFLVNIKCDLHNIESFNQNTCFNAYFADKNAEFFIKLENLISFIEYNFDMYKLCSVNYRYLQKFNSCMIFELNVESFIKHISQHLLNVLSINVNGDSKVSKFYLVLNDIDYIRNYRFINTINLNQVHVHLTKNSGIGEILSCLKCK